MTEVVVIIGTGSIGLSIARRVSAGKRVLLADLRQKLLGERYIAAGPEFRRAWLKAQDGEEEQALLLLGQVPEAETGNTGDFYDIFDEVVDRCVMTAPEA